MSFAARSRSTRPTPEAPEVFNIDACECFEAVGETPLPVLAVGAERQSSACCLHAARAILCGSLGDLMDPRVYRAFREQIVRRSRLESFAPATIAHDMHPLYVSTQYAREWHLPLVAVQHHHAHIVSVMAEHRWSHPVIGICCDGVGFGDDGAAWGCEVMCCTPAEYHRVGHLDYFPLLGGDAAATETWRSAFALVQQALGALGCCRDIAAFSHVPTDQLDAMERLANSTLNAPPTSSLGRVFDGVSFLLGLCDRNTQPAQAAIALERVALPATLPPYPYETTVTTDGVHMSLAATIRAILRDLERHENRGRISARFHETVARMLTATTIIAAEKHNIDTVVLAGGCFANLRLRERTTDLLQKRHLRALIPSRVPIGDAGIALGQATIAAAMLKGAR